MFPDESPARQNDAERQNTLANGVFASTRVTFQAAAPLAGWMEVSTLPAWSTATHSDNDGHEIPTRFCPPSTFLTAQADAPPAGSVEVTTSPALSTATQSDADGHD